MDTNNLTVIEWVRGSFFPYIIIVTQKTTDGSTDYNGNLVWTETDYTVTDSDTVLVNFRGAHGIYTMTHSVDNDGHIVVEDNGDMPDGTYAIEIIITQSSGKRFRWQAEQRVRLNESIGESDMQAAMLRADIFYFAKGDEGNGIEGIALTSTVVDQETGQRTRTYTISFTDGNDETYDIVDLDGTTFQTVINQVISAAADAAAAAAAADAAEATAAANTAAALANTKAAVAQTAAEAANTAKENADTATANANAAAARAEAAAAYLVDEELDESSENPVQNKVVTDAITYSGDFDLSEAVVNDYFINTNSSPVWAKYTGVKGIFIPVTARQRIRVVGNGNASGTVYAFVTAMPTTTGESVSFADGYSARASVTGTTPFDIVAPNDAVYLWIMYKNSDGIMMPTLEEYKFLPDLKQELASLESARDAERLVDLSAYEDTHRAISGINKWDTAALQRAYSRLMPVTAGQQFKIIASENASIYAFLTSADENAANLSTPSFCTGHGSRVIMDPSAVDEITIPDDCEYLYLTSYSYDMSICFLPTLFLSDFNIPHLLEDVKSIESELEEMEESLGELDDAVNASVGVNLSRIESYSKFINVNNVWNTYENYESKVIAVSSGDRVVIRANDTNGSFYALLTSSDEDAGVRTTPSFCSGFEGRISIPYGNTKIITIPSDCTYLYVFIGQEGADFTPTVWINPFIGVEQEEDDYMLVYEENFDHGLDTDMWKPSNFMSSGYNSHFLADSDNWYADGGCMVLKLEKRNGSYYGPYISTAKTFAISRGKIEVRIKTTMVHTSFAWCFWTFGQNDAWPIPLEMDLFEKIANRSNLQTHLHYKNTSNSNADKTGTAISQSDFGTDWHTMALEWDAEKIITYLDGEQIDRFDYASLNNAYPITYPQHLCFNIKCGTGYDEGDAYLFVDYVKVWATKDSSPITGFEQEDLTMTVGETAHINPTFVPSDCINKAFTLTSDDSSIVSVEESEYGYPNHYIERKITAASAGVANLTITAANGVTTKTFTVTVTE